MIKLCYVIGQLNRAGAEQQLYYLVKGLNKEKFCPVVVSLSQGGYWSEEIRKLNVQVIEIPRSKHKEVSRLIRLVRVLKKSRPQMIHTFLFSANTYGRVAGILARVPFIIASERNLPEIGKDKNVFKLYIDKFLALFTDGIICNSRKAADTLIKKYSFSEKKVFTVHNGINGASFIRNDSQREKIAPYVVGTVGRLYSQKNHKLFLDMAKLLLNSYGRGDMKFLIVGDGPLRNELEDYARHLKIDSSVLFAGERTDVPELLQDMDIFVTTSSYEGLSNTIMEAMSAGLPVVATDVGGNGELIVNGETGFICPPNDAHVLAGKVESLIKNQQQAQQMGAKGRARIVNEFGIEKMIRETENVYLKTFREKSLKVVTARKFIQ
jgi:glycosyltransferase involved in cell wall biosynthesis